MLDPVLNVEMQEEMVLYHTHFRDAVHLIPGFKNFQELHLQARARSEHSTGRNEAAHITQVEDGVPEVSQVEITENGQEPNRESEIAEDFDFDSEDGFPDMRLYAEFSDDSDSESD